MLLLPLCNFCLRVVWGSGLLAEAAAGLPVLVPADVAEAGVDFVALPFGVWGVVWPRVVVATSSEPMSNLIMTLS